MDVSIPTYIAYTKALFIHCKQILIKIHSLLSIYIDIHHTDLPLSSLDLSYDGSQSPGSGGNVSSSHSRSKRMRTSFKHHQLRTMKSYFAINQNPDAKDLKQLAQKTGLSKRVLQVRGPKK